MKILALYFYFTTSAFATGSEISLLKKEGPKKITAQRSQRKVLTEFNELKQNNELIKKLLMTKTSTPLIWDGSAKIQAGKTIRGMLLNSIVSTNLESPIVVEVLPDQGIPVGTKLLCLGVTKFKRVQSFCQKLVTKTKELPVSVELLNLDGSAGLLGVFDDGKEDLVTGMIVSNLSQAVIAGAQGGAPKGKLTSELLEGGFNTAKGVSDLTSEELKTKEPIVMIDAGTEVLIFFKEGIDEF